MHGSTRGAGGAPRRARAARDELRVDYWADVRVCGPADSSAEDARVEAARKLVIAPRRSVSPPVACNHPTHPASGVAFRRMMGGGGGSEAEYFTFRMGHTARHVRRRPTAPLAVVLRPWRPGATARSKSQIVMPLPLLLAPAVCQWLHAGGRSGYNLLKSAGLLLPL